MKITRCDVKITSCNQLITSYKAGMTATGGPMGLRKAAKTEKIGVLAPQGATVAPSQAIMPMPASMAFSCSGRPFIYCPFFPK